MIVILQGDILKVIPEKTFTLDSIFHFYLFLIRIISVNAIFKGVAKDRTLLLRPTLQGLPSYYFESSLICFSNTNYTIYQIFLQKKIIFKCFSEKVYELFTQKMKTME